MVSSRMHLLSAIVVGSLSTTGWAHKPSFGNDHASADSAFQIIDPDISIVLYAEISCTAPVVWMEMNTGDRDEIWVELGVPMLDRFVDYRPSLAVIGPGLPDADVPFDLPDGMGATIINTDDVEEPSEFYEPFTQTDSWILYQGWLEVPPESTVYLAAWDPEEFTGKLWVAVGKIEDFSDVGIDQFTEWVELTQAYYEFDDTEEHVELDCSLVAERPDDSTPSTQKTEGCGCTQGPTNHAPWVLLFGPLVVWLRRFHHPQK